MTARLRLTLVAAMATLLGGLTMSSVFVDADWFWPVLVSVIAGAGGCALGRRVGAPRPVVPLVGLATLTLVITWTFARDVAVLGFIPGPGALRELNALLVTAMNDLQRFATPAPTEQGLLLLTALGLGASTVAVDTLAVTYRSAALAGIPLLALYAVPASVVRDGVPWVLFVAASIGWLALMLAEGRERLSGWGRALGRRSSRGDGIFTAAPSEPLGVVGRRIGAAALGLAVIFPAFVPLFGSGIFGGSGPGGSGSGSGSGSGTTTINPLVGIANDLTARTNTPVFDYVSNDSNPDYLRMVTLDSFDGINWNVAKLSVAGSASELGAGTSGNLPGAPITTQIRMTGLKTPWLPLPYPTRGIRGLTGNWSYDLATEDVFARGGDTTFGRSYDVSSTHPALTAASLRGAGSSAADPEARYTNLPSGLPALVKTTEVAITKGRTNDYDKAIAIQDFFLDPKNRFIYTTQLPESAGSGGSAGSPLVAFLTNRAGFCQQYATMYAVMARMAGLPTRVNVGFTRGSPKTAGVWVVTRQNAHAWPEVYFHGVGWVRFEPTPGPSGVQTPSWARGPGADGGNSFVPTPSTPQTGPNGGRNRDAGDDAITPLPATTAVAIAEGRHWALVPGAVAVALALLTPAAARVLRRRRRLRHASGGTPGAAGVLAAWRELGDTSQDLGLPWASSRTPRRTAGALVAYGLEGEAAAAVRRLALAVERVHYAREDAPRPTGADPGADARLVVKAMAAASPTKIRWRARLFPASVLAVAGAGVADALDWVDGLSVRIRSALVRLLPGRMVGRGT